MPSVHLAAESRAPGMFEADGVPKVPYTPAAPFVLLPPIQVHSPVCPRACMLIAPVTRAMLKRMVRALIRTLVAIKDRHESVNRRSYHPLQHRHESARLKRMVRALIRTLVAIFNRRESCAW